MNGHDLEYLYNHSNNTQQQLGIQALFHSANVRVIVDGHRLCVKFPHKIILHKSFPLQFIFSKSYKSLCSGARWARGGAVGGHSHDEHPGHQVGAGDGLRAQPG